MPAPHDLANGGADACPNGIGRAEDHFGSEDGIYLERGQNGRATGFLLFRVPARQPLAGEENGFFPSRLIKNFRLQPFVAESGITDALQDQALDEVGGVPLLKLLVLK